MRISKRAPRGATAIALALVAALLIAACGGSSSSGSSNASSTTSSTSTSAGGSSTTSTRPGAAALTAFRACLKQHGITLPAGGFGGRRPGTGTGTFTRPTGTPPAGGGFGGGGFGGGFAGGGSKFATAFRDCGSKLPRGAGFGRFGGGFGGAGAATRRVRFSAATLDAFVACIRKNGYPAMPNPNTSGTGAPFPSSVATNPQFKAAEPKCLSLLRPTGAPAGAGAGATGNPGGPQAGSTTTTTASA